MANKFTWFPKFTNALERVPDGLRAQLLWAIVQYGTNGVEPEFDSSNCSLEVGIDADGEPISVDCSWSVGAVFESIREDIDNSVGARVKNKGGRPRKAKPEPEPEPRNENGGFEVSETDKTWVSESENGGFEVSETQETPPYIPNQSIPVQAIDSPSQCRTDAMRAAPDDFAPPTLDECRAYFAANCISGDPDKFWAHYESQGWIRSNGMPVTSLKAAAMLWNGNQKRLDAEAHARGKPTDAEIQAATFKPTRTPEQTRAELERRWREEHPGIDPAKVKAPRGTTADPVALKAYQDARRLLDARAACERRAS